LTGNNDFAVELAILKYKYEELEEKFDKVDLEIKDLKEQNKKVEIMAARWKGGGALLLALGSLAGFVFAYYDKVKGLFAKIGAS
jgi:hypothetical protein